MIKLIKLILKKYFSKYNELFFVGSADKLPEPLSKEEEDILVTKFHNGDLKAKDKLIEHNLRLVVFLSKKYENTKIDLEDLVSIGTIGLIKGINTYKGDKNIKLATYASRCIDNEILMYLRKNKKRRADVSLEESLSYDKDQSEYYLNVIDKDYPSNTFGIIESNFISISFGGKVFVCDFFYIKAHIENSL